MTPDTVETRIGTLSFENGFPTEETARKLFDELDYQRAVQAYLWAYPAVSFESIRIGTKRDLGTDINDMIIADNFADPKGRWLTANDTTIYSLTNVDLGKSGPVVVEIPPGAIVGIIDDFWQRSISDVGLPGPYGLAPWEYTIAELLSDSGYATALYGKWHLGSVQGRLPTNQGFDEWWGYKDSMDEAGWDSYAVYRELIKATGGESPKIWEGRKGEPSKPVRDLNMEVRPFMDEMIAKHTTDYIAKHAEAGKPFFVYTALSHSHPPEKVHPDFDQKSPQRLGAYSDMIAEMDFRAGQILDAIKQAGVEDNTILIFSSDNGAGGIPAVLGGSSGPWRGYFSNPPYEGSMRVPAIIRWPGHVPAGVVSQEMLTAHDWLPTLAGMVGESSRVPKDRPIDGIDASGFMLGTSQTTGREAYLFFGPDAGPMSVKWRNIKVIFRYADSFEKPIEKPYWLLVYDLTSDPHEDYNIMVHKMDMTWMLGPAGKVVTDYEKSVAEFPK
jgi:arylsulfatase